MDPDGSGWKMFLNQFDGKGKRSDLELSTANDTKLSQKQTAQSRLIAKEPELAPDPDSTQKGNFNKGLECG